MTPKNVDVLLVGAGAMSSTLGVLLQQLDPELSISMVERLNDVAEESTSGWNNAGTGHAAYCELNYTPEKADGSLDASKAYQINTAFEQSLQFWAYLVEQKALPKPHYFITSTPHLSFVWGEENVNYLRKRYELLSQHHLFEAMEYTEDPAVLQEWIPLVMEGRDPKQKVAATRIRHGSDVNFASLCRSMVGHLQTSPHFDLYLNHNVTDLKHTKNHEWDVAAKDLKSGKVMHFHAKFVFLGAGGGALPLLQKSELPKGKKYAGFPVSGQWLVCKNPAIVERHLAKVYGKASIGAPPMSVPHLDTRVIDGENALLFGPFAGFSTKFLKHGSFMDLILSIRPNNLVPMVQVGIKSYELVRYLITEVMQTHKSRMKSLHDYFPLAEASDWKLATAGQRVQVIKNDPKTGGKLEFGTEVVAANDHSLAALLGASPGASVAVQAMLQVLEQCYPDRMASEEWQTKLKTMVPSYGSNLVEDADLLRRIRPHALHVLGLSTEDNVTTPLPTDKDSPTSKAA